VTATLTEAETAALFAGSLAPLRALRMPVTPPRDYVARYDRCSACRDLTPALLTFTGETDWSPWVPLDDPLRDAVRSLRRSTGRRTILLCSPCVDDLRRGPPPAPVSSDTARLFEL